MVLAPAGCGESCGLPVPAHRICVISACWAGQSCQARQKLSKCSFCLQDNGWVGVSGNWCLISVTKGCGRVYSVEVAGSLDFLSVMPLWPDEKTYRHVDSVLAQSYRGAG